MDYSENYSDSVRTYHGGGILAVTGADVVVSVGRL